MMPTSEIRRPHAIRAIEVKGAFCQSHAEARGRRATHVSITRAARTLSIEFLKEGGVPLWRRKEFQEVRLLDQLVHRFSLH